MSIIQCETRTEHPSTLPSVSPQHSFSPGLCSGWFRLEATVSHVQVVYNVIVVIVAVVVHVVVLQEARPAQETHGKFKSSSIK